MLKPLVHKELVIDIDPRYQPYFNTGPIWKVTVVPRKGPGTDVPLETVIMLPANLRTGALQIQNLGRYPVSLPDAAVDDLRPLSFLVSGSGSQDVKVVNRRNRNEYFIETVTI